MYWRIHLCFARSPVVLRDQVIRAMANSIVISRGVSCRLTAGLCDRNLFVSAFTALVNGEKETVRVAAHPLGRKVSLSNEERSPPSDCIRFNEVCPEKTPVFRAHVPSFPRIQYAARRITTDRERFLIRLLRTVERRQLRYDSPVLPSRESAAIKLSHVKNN